MANLKIRSEIAAEVGDNHIKLQINMSGLPKELTDYIREKHEEFIRAMQESVVDFLGTDIEKIDTLGILRSTDKPITSEDVENLRKSVNEKDPSLN